MTKQPRHRYEIPQEKIEEISRLLNAVSGEIGILHDITAGLSSAMVQEDDKAQREAISESLKLIRTQSGAIQKLHHSVSEISKICLELHESGASSQDHLYDCLRELQKVTSPIVEHSGDLVEMIEFHQAAKTSVKSIGMIKRAVIWVASLVASIGALGVVIAKFKGVS
jgi:hypothetical protein